MEITQAEVEAAHAALLKHGSVTKAAAALGIPRTSFSRRLAKTQSAAPPKRAGRSISEFRELHDRGFIVPRKIKQALAQLGPDGWDYEIDFARLAGVSLIDLGVFRDQFESHWLVIGRSGKRAWAGTAATAKRLREMSGVFG